MTLEPVDKNFSASVNRCARCGQDHELVAFNVLLNHPEDITHFGTCPNTQQPILMLMKEDAQEQGDKT